MRNRKLFRTCGRIQTWRGTRVLACAVFISAWLPAPCQDTAAWRRHSPDEENESDAEAAILDTAIPQVPLEQAITLLGSASPKTIVLGQGVQRGNVVAFFKDIEFNAALEAFARANELCVVEDELSILLVTREEFMAQYANSEIVSVTNAAPDALATILENSGANSEDLISITADVRGRSLLLRGARDQIDRYKELVISLDTDLETITIPVRYAAAQRIAESLRSVLFVKPDTLGLLVVDERSNRLVITDKPERLQTAVSLVEELDVQVHTRVFFTGRMDALQVVEQLKKGELGAPGEGSSTSGGAVSLRSEARVQAVEGTNQVIVTDTLERLAHFEKVIEELTGNIRSVVIRPRNATAPEIQALVSEAFPEVTTAVDARTGSLVVTADKHQMESIEELIERLDSTRNVQVIIEARIMLVSTDRKKEIGIRLFGQDLDGLNESLVNLSFNPNFAADFAKEIGSPLGNPPDGPITNPVKTTDRWTESVQPNVKAELLVRALEQDGDTQLLSSPTLRMLMGQTSSIFSGTSEPYREVTFQDQNAIENVRFIDVGVTFEVTPYVSPENVLTLAVSTEFSSLTEVRDGIPVVDTRRADSTVEVADGALVFLGGLITREEQQRRSGIPFLVRIPILGKLFGETRDRYLERELVIVLEPRIENRNVEEPQVIPESYHLVPETFAIEEADRLKKREAN